jgi:hypothetical protein
MKELKNKDIERCKNLMKFAISIIEALDISENHISMYEKYYLENKTFISIGLDLGCSAPTVSNKIERLDRRLENIAISVKGKLKDSKKVPLLKTQLQTSLTFKDDIKEYAKNIIKIIESSPKKDRLIEETALSIRSINVLRLNKIRTVSQLATINKKKLMRMRNLGHQCICEIEYVLESYGYQLLD